MIKKIDEQLVLLWKLGILGHNEWIIIHNCPDICGWHNYYISDFGGFALKKVTYLPEGSIVIIQNQEIKCPTCGHINP